MEDPLTPIELVTNAFTTSAAFETTHVSVNHLTWHEGTIGGNLIASTVMVQNPFTEQFQETALTFDSPYVDGPTFGVLDGAQTWTLRAGPGSVGNAIVARDAAGNFSAAEITADRFYGNVDAPSLNATVDVRTPWMFGNVTGVTVDVTGNVSAPLLTGNVVRVDSYVETPVVFGNVVGTHVETDTITGNLTGDVHGNVTGETVAARTVAVETSITTGTLTADTVLSEQVQSNVVTFDDAYGSLTGDVMGNLTGDVAGNLLGDVTGNLTGNVTGNLFGNVVGDVQGNLTGDVNGNISGDVTGNITGSLTGNINGDIIGNVTGDLTGNVSGDLFGNADTASVWKTPRTFAVSGDVTGSVVLDGSESVTLFASIPGMIDNRLSVGTGGTGTSLLVSNKVLVGNGTNAVQTPTGLHWDFSSARFGIHTSSPQHALDVHGNIHATGDIVGFSDGRYKTGVRTIANALEKVGRLSGVTFETVHEPGLRKMGMIAQDVEPVVPEVVTTDASSNRTKGIAYGNVVALLIEAIKELREENARLKQRMDEWDANRAS